MAPHLRGLFLIYHFGLIIMHATDSAKKADGFAHIRVDRKALQRLRYAIACRGGTFHGSLQREASTALMERASALLKKAKAEANCAEVDKD